MTSAVTGVREHARRRGRIVVEVDGADVAVVSLDTIAELGIATGRPATPALLRDLEVANRQTALLDRALGLLAARGRSVRELRSRLKRLEASAPDIAWVVERLQSLGYLDDAVFARQLAQGRLQRGVSRRAIQNELFRKGVPRDVALEAITAASDEVQADEFGAALALARKRTASLANLDPAVRLRRLYGFLARRGYEPELVSRVVRTVLNRDGNA